MDTGARFLFFMVIALIVTCSQQQEYERKLRYSGSITPLQILAQWGYLSFGFPTERDRQTALSNGNLIPQNAIPIDLQPDYSSTELNEFLFIKKNNVRFFAVTERSRILVTVPRFSNGIPYTLATVSSDNVLKPYPQYSWHNKNGEDCDAITSAFRVAITPCKQMWVIDSGVIGTSQRCPPQLLLFDLITDRLIYRYRFTSNLYTPGASLFISPILKVDDPPPNGNCQYTTVYIPDVNFHGLVVYDYAQNTAWRAEHRFMYPDPDYGVHTISGTSFPLMDGIFSLAVVGRNLYFHPLASISEYAVPVNVLADRKAFENSVESYSNYFVKVGERVSELFYLHTFLALPIVKIGRK